MRSVVTAAALALLVLGGGPAETAWAQEPAPPTVSAPAKPERFLALDIFGGWALCCEPVETPGTGEESKTEGGSGWEVGATVLYGKPWLGIKGAVGRTKTLDLPVWQVTAGPQVSVGKAFGRLLAHAVVGYAKTSGVTPAKGSVVWGVGGAIDLLFFRFQADYVRLNIDGLQKNNSRGFFAVVVPLCFRACENYWGAVGQ